MNHLELYNRSRVTRFRSLALSGLLLFSLQSSAAIRLPAIFSDHMVIQQNARVRVWGSAAPGERVQVQLGDFTQSTTADRTGKWSVRLKQKFKAGDVLTLVVRGKENSVEVNDVLVGEVWLCSGQSNMVMTTDHSDNYENEQAQAVFPGIRMFTVERSARTNMQSDCVGRWEICSPETVGKFSAVAYFFGRSLHQELRKPVGLINSSYGATSIEAWTSWEAQAKLPEFRTIFSLWAERIAQPWDEVAAQAKHEQQMAEWKEKAAKAKAAQQRLPTAPTKPVAPRLDRNYPGNVFNAMIAPLVGYPIRGVIWCQGESNAGKPHANLYGLQLRTLIQDWRRRWDENFPFAWVQLPEFTPLQSQPVEDSGRAIVREQMLETLKVSDTGMVITLGLGEAKNIHPTNKQAVGQRLAAWALNRVCERQNFSASGPLPARIKVRGSQIAISFKETYGGLKGRDGKLAGFALAGNDRNFVWADARIDGDTVVVTHPGIKRPVAVRYAWADNPVWSLLNAADLPATPFRSDDWPLASSK